MVIESRKMSWTGHLERMGKRRDTTGFWWGDLKERDSLEHLYVDRTLKIAIQEVGYGTWTGLI